MFISHSCQTLLMPLVMSDLLVALSFCSDSKGQRVRNLNTLFMMPSMMPTYSYSKLVDLRQI